MLHPDKQVKRDRGEEQRKEPSISTIQSGRIWRKKRKKISPFSHSFFANAIKISTSFRNKGIREARYPRGRGQKKKRKETKMESDETNFPCSNSRPGSYGLFSQNTTSPELRAQLEFHCIAAGVYGNGTLTSWRGGNG